MGRVEVCLIKRRDGGSRRGELSDRLPSLPARLHAVPNEPQQGNTNLPKPTCFYCLPYVEHEPDYFLFVCVCVCGHQCVSVEQVPPQVDQESVEIDDFLDNSMAGSSFLFYNGEVESHMKIQDETLNHTRYVIDVFFYFIVESILR